MKAHAVHVRIARLSIDRQLAGGFSTDLIADAVRAELASRLGGADATVRLAGADASPARHLAQTIAGAVSDRLPPAGAAHAAGASRHKGTP